ncbi:MAG TPA: imidazoleglycerol-phosphate dehydratase HisB [Candidatus Polarisedimenticolia bacterium]|nr:imidazoleglycerol-phosphate dehydratase HisB [Candidatus Polarisedimenticolia bacterium]
MTTRRRSGRAKPRRAAAPRRVATLRRATRETEITVRLAIEGRGKVRVATGLGFLDHMLSALALHGGLDLDLEARGDLHVDQHHLVEDCGIAIGQALSRALRDRRGIERTGFFAFPMEESLALAALDLGGRPSLVYKARFRRLRVGDLETDTIPEFLRGLTRGLLADLHIVLPYGWNDHHKAEALFKAVGKALKLALCRDGRYRGLVPSTKGTLE